MSDPHQRTLAPAQPLVAGLVASFLAVWPNLAVENELDPFILDNVTSGSFGPCPWACTDIAFLDVVGLSTLEIEPNAVVLKVNRCNALAPVVELSLPFSLRTLKTSTHAQAQISRAPLTFHPIVDFGPATGHLRVVIPFAVVGLSALLDLSQTSVSMYVNLERVSSSLFFPRYLFNAVMQAGLKKTLCALLQSKVSSVLTRLVRTSAALTAPLQWSIFLLPGYFDALPPAPPDNPCKFATQSEFIEAPCEPCDTCCLCASQGRCADPECESCETCMPHTCASQITWTLWVAGVATVLVVLAVVLLLFIVAGVMVGGLVWGIEWIVVHAKDSHLHPQVLPSPLSLTLPPSFV
jgi:hypothetical protein